MTRVDGNQKFSQGIGRPEGKTTMLEGASFKVSVTEIFALSAEMFLFFNTAFTA